MRYYFYFSYEKYERLKRPSCFPPSQIRVEFTKTFWDFIVQSWKTDYISGNAPVYYFIKKQRKFIFLSVNRFL